MTLRRVSSAVLGVVAVLALVGVVLGAWVRWTLLETDRFMAAIRPMIASQAVTDAVGSYITEETFEALEIDRRVEESLVRMDEYLVGRLAELLGREAANRVDNTPRFADLADPLTASARQRVTRSVQEVLGSEGVRALVSNSVEESHRVAVALVREDYEAVPNFSVDAEAVKLDLLPIIARVLEQGAAADVTIPGIDTSLGSVADAVVPQETRDQLAEGLAVRLGPDFGRVTILSADQLNAVQRVVRLLDGVMWGFTALALVAALGSLGLAATRVRASMFLSIGVLLAMATVWSVVRDFEAFLLAEVGDPLASAVTAEVVPAILSELRSLLAWFIGFFSAAVLLSLLAVTSGKRVVDIGRLWLEDGRLVRVVRTHGDALMVAGIGLGVVGIVLFELGPMGVVVLLSVVGVYVVVLRALGRGSSPTDALEAAPRGTRR